MKTITIKFYLFLISICSFYSGFAQVDPCGTKPFDLDKVKEIEKIALTYLGINSVGITYLPVKLHLTQEYGYTTYYPLNQLVYEFSKLNEKFLPFGFQFYLCDSVNYIDNYVLDELNGGYDLADSLALKANNVNNAINLYYVNYSNVGGRSNFPSGDKFYNWMFVVNGNWDFGETLVHEMGHYFNLYHTFETFFGTEKVNGSNCSSAGDYVCDTPADRSPAQYDKINCTYNGSYTDVNGQSYTPLVPNYMSYYSGGCINNFTNGQISRAQAGHATRLSLINSNGNQYGFTYPSNDTINVSNLRVFELHGSVRLRWNANALSLGFIIERSTSPSSGFVAIGGMSFYILEFIEKDVVGGTTYYYRVKSVNSAAHYSPVVSFTPTSSSYAYGSDYSTTVHDVRYFYFYNNTGQIKLSAFFDNYLDPYTDASNKVSYNIEAGKKYRVYWLDYYTTSSDRDSFKVWIDFNQNKMFENAEIMAKGYGPYSTDSLLIPPNTPTGYYRLRFRTNHFNAAFSHSDRQLYSDTKDITLFIQGTCANSLPVMDYLGSDVISGQSIKTVDYTFLYPDPFAGYPVKLSAPSVTLNPGFFADGYNTFIADTNGCN